MKERSHERETGGNKREAQPLVFTPGGSTAARWTPTPPAQLLCYLPKNSPLPCTCTALSLQATPQSLFTGRKPSSGSCHPLPFRTDYACQQGCHDCVHLSLFPRWSYCSQHPWSHTRPGIPSLGPCTFQIAMKATGAPGFSHETPWAWRACGSPTFSRSCLPPAERANGR